MSGEEREVIPETQVDEPVMSDNHDSDDEFGDFEEVDQVEEVQEPVVETVTPPQAEKKIPVYDGNYAGNERGFLGLIDIIFGGIPSLSSSPEKTSNNKQETEKFEFDERAGKIFDQLIMDDKPPQHIIWKKSMIFKQLMLNLDIPVEDINHIAGTAPKLNSTHNTSEFRDLYEFQRAIKEDVDLEKILKQVPKFKSLGIEKNGETFNQKLTDTPTIITEAQTQINEQPEDKERYLVSLMNVKKELLELLSVWDERISDTKADNELFSSYVENLIGNTQKFRRVSKKAK